MHGCICVPIRTTLLTDIGGSDVEPSLRGSGGGVCCKKKFLKAAAEVTTVELFCFLCHRKDNNLCLHICSWQF